MLDDPNQRGIDRLQRPVRPIRNKVEFVERADRGDQPSQRSGASIAKVVTRAAVRANPGSGPIDPGSLAVMVAFP